MVYFLLITVIAIVDDLDNLIEEAIKDTPKLLNLLKFGICHLKILMI